MDFFFPTKKCFQFPVSISECLSVSFQMCCWSCSSSAWVGHRVRIGWCYTLMLRKSFLISWRSKEPTSRWKIRVRTSRLWSLLLSINIPLIRPFPGRAFGMCTLCHPHADMVSYRLEGGKTRKFTPLLKRYWRPRLPVGRNILFRIIILKGPSSC